MRLTWNGHACFTIQAQEGTVVLDPYEDFYVPGLAPLNVAADRVYCSHDHKDHNASQVVKRTGVPCNMVVHILPSWHDEVQGAKRGSNQIHLFETEGMRVAHLGDLGCPLAQEQIEALSGVDVLMIPVGGFYTIDPQQAHAIVAQVKPRIVIPMHYRSSEFGYEVLSEVEEFLCLCAGPVTRLDTNSVELTRHTPAQTIRFSYCPG